MTTVIGDANILLRLTGREAGALAGYLAGTLSRYQVQQLLGFDNRWDAEEWLGAHAATVQYTIADLDQDRATLNALLGPLENTR